MTHLSLFHFAVFYDSMILSRKNEKGEQVTIDVEKIKVFKKLFASVFTGSQNVTFLMFLKFWMGDGGIESILL